MTIKSGLATKLGIGVSLLSLLPPAITQIVALVENVTVHWSGAEKTSAIIGGASALAVMFIRGAQAVAAILKGSTSV